MATPLILATAERIITSEPWYITAGVALGAALFGSGVGAVSTYQLNVRLDKRSRVARAEIRRKAKIYTPIRAELLAVRDDVANDKHIAYFGGILREDRGYKTVVNPPELYLWRVLVEDGRAMASASVHVRHALNALEQCVDTFNQVISRAGEIFQHRADAIFDQLSAHPTSVSNWTRGQAPLLVRHRFAELFANAPMGTPLDAVVLKRFTEAWDRDAEVTEVTRELTQAESALSEALDVAINELEKAMRRVARQHESEPED